MTDSIPHPKFQIGVAANAAEESPDTLYINE